ncbi:MAG: hypothetical protein JOY93_09465 [Acidobacteriales bacterium]|nr:hypothetical protein [Terriglobales bacterium]
MKKFSKLFALLVLIVPLAAAQQSRIYREGGDWVQEISGSLSPAKLVHVKVDMGAVHVSGGAKADVTYMFHNRVSGVSEQDARRHFDSYKIQASLRGDTLWIAADWKGPRPHRFSGDFVINIPRNTDLVKVETDGGSVTANGISGKLDAQSGGGSIHVDDIGGTVNAETGGGSIDVGSVGSDLNLHTGGGAIKVASAKGKIHAESGGGSVAVVSGLQGAVLATGGGNIHIGTCTGTVKASTGGGSIDLGDIAGPAEVETAGGSIRLASATGQVRAATGSGAIELNAVPGARAQTGSGGIVAKFVASNGQRSDSILETSAGDIVVYLSPSIHVTVRASIEAASGHGIHSDFSEIRVNSEGGEWGPKNITAEGTLNGGGPVLKIRTTNGDISLRRASR